MKTSNNQNHDDSQMRMQTYGVALSAQQSSISYKEKEEVRLRWNLCREALNSQTTTKPSVLLLPTLQTGSICVRKTR